MSKLFKSYFKYGNSQLYSIGGLNYFGSEGKLWYLKTEILAKMISETQKMNPQMAIQHLISNSHRFKALL